MYSQFNPLHQPRFATLPDSKASLANQPVTVARSPKSDIVRFSGQGSQRPPLDSLNELQARQDELKAYYEQAQRIATFIMEKLPPSFQNNTNKELNLQYDRIPFNSGIGLRVHGGIPYALLTPLGTMPIAFRNKFAMDQIPSIMAELTQALGLKEILPEVPCHSGYGPQTTGPIYAITKDPTIGQPVPELNASGLVSAFDGNYSPVYEQYHDLAMTVIPQARLQHQRKKA